MSNLTVRVAGHTFYLPKKCVILNSDLFDLHPDLHDSPSYDVESAVDLDDCQTFLKFLQTKDESLLTSTNCRALRALAGEFGVPRLIELCSKLEAAQLNRNLNARVLVLEDAASQQGAICESLARDFAGSLFALSEELRQLRKDMDAGFCAISSKMESSRTELEQSIGNVRSETGSMVATLRSATKKMLDAFRADTRGMKLALGLTDRECPLKDPELFGGMISYLTKEHGGNVHEKGIVKITASSVCDRDPKHAPKNLADLASSDCFCSMDKPGQWVCWDFGEMRVRPTHYQIAAPIMKSWAVEGSLDGLTWTEMHQRTSQAFSLELGIQCFAFSTTGKFRFIRLTQTDTRHCGDNKLACIGVDFCGTLSE
jgi:hypothetical protein